MRSSGRAASTNRFEVFRTKSSLSPIEPDRSNNRTRSKGVLLAAKNVISCGTPLSRIEKSFCSRAVAELDAVRLKTLTLRFTRSESMRRISAGSGVWAGETRGHKQRPSIKNDQISRAYANFFDHDGETKQSLILSCSLRKVATFTAGNGVRSIHVTRMVRQDPSRTLFVVDRTECKAFPGRRQRDRRRRPNQKAVRIHKGAAAASAIPSFDHARIERLLLNVELAQRS